MPSNGYGDDTMTLRWFGPFVTMADGSDDGSEMLNISDYLCYLLPGHPKAAKIERLQLDEVRRDGPCGPLGNIHGPQKTAMTIWHWLLVHCSLGAKTWSNRKVFSWMQLSPQ